MFVVFSLPRSRSAWLSVFLDGGHDIGAECSEPADFVQRLNGLNGTCETGAAFAWPLIRQEIPLARFAVVFRDPEEVAASLRRFGLDGYIQEMFTRHGHLIRIAQQPGTFACRYDDLRDTDCCRALHEHCLGEPMDVARWERLDRLNIQVDMGRQIGLLAEGHSRIENLKAMAVERMARA